MCAFTCSPNQQLTTFLLDPPFCWVVQVRSLSLRHLAAIASGERPGPTSFEPAPLLPFRLQRLDHQRANDRAALLDPEKASSGTRMRPYRRTPGPRAPPAPGRRSICIEMYAPIQDPEAATDARDERAFGYWNHFR